MNCYRVVWEVGVSRHISMSIVNLDKFYAISLTSVMVELHCLLMVEAQSLPGTKRLDVKWRPGFCDSRVRYHTTDPS